MAHPTMDPLSYPQFPPPTGTPPTPRPSVLITASTCGPISAARLRQLAPLQPSLHPSRKRWIRYEFGSLGVPRTLYASVRREAPCPQRSNRTTAASGSQCASVADRLGVRPTSPLRRWLSKLPTLTTARSTQLHPRSLLFGQRQQWPLLRLPPGLRLPAAERDHATYADQPRSSGRRRTNSQRRCS